MTDEQYTQTQRTLMRLAVELQGLDLDGFLARIAEAEAAGPVTDPTLFRRGAPALAAVKAVALDGRKIVATYEEHAGALLGPLLDAYSREELAAAGIV
jgi:hypothetical protein